MSKPPNVIVFLTDQQRWDSTGMGGNPLGLTPHFDRIAQANTYVANSFTCQPVCGPARACLQTGQYATATGCWGNGIRLPTDRPTLAQCFNEAGYRTGYIGKWHLAGSDNPGKNAWVPEDRRGGYRDWLGANALEGVSKPYDARLWDEENREVRLPGYRVDALTDAAIRYVQDRTAEKQPFMLFLSHLEPHYQNRVDDFVAPDGYRELYQGRWTPPDLAGLPCWAFDGGDPNRRRLGGSAARHLAGYWGIVRRLDEAFGRLMDALQSLEIDRDTVVLFSTDHGCHFKTRSREYKQTCHESSIRLPTLFAGPGFEGGGQIPQLVNLVDLPPTLLDAAGIPVPDTMQGRSLLPLLRRDFRDWPDDVFIQINAESDGRAVRTRRWKYGVLAEPPARGRADAYGEESLYDLRHDPYELHNLVEHESHAELRARLRERLMGYIQRIEGETPEITPAPGGPGRLPAPLRAPLPEEWEE